MPEEWPELAFYIKESLKDAKAERKELRSAVGLLREEVIALKMKMKLQSGGLGAGTAGAVVALVEVVKHFVS